MIKNVQNFIEKINSDNLCKELINYDKVYYDKGYDYIVFEFKNDNIVDTFLKNEKLSFFFRQCVEDSVDYLIGKKFYIKWNNVDDYTYKNPGEILYNDMFFNLLFNSDIKYLKRKEKSAPLFIFNGIITRKLEEHNFEDLKNVIDSVIWFSKNISYKYSLYLLNKYNDVLDFINNILMKLNSDFILNSKNINNILKLYLIKYKNDNTNCYCKFSIFNDSIILYVTNDIERDIILFNKYKIKSVYGLVLVLHILENMFFDKDMFLNELQLSVLENNV